MSGRGMVVAIVALLAFLLGSNAVFVVRETERGVMLRFGEIVREDLNPGLHFKVPFVNAVRKFDGRIMTADSRPERFLTLEKKALIVDAFAKWRVSVTPRFYEATNGEEARAEALLMQRINDGLRNQVASRTVYDVVSGERDQLMENITRDLSVMALEELGVELVDIRVKRIDLPTDVSTSVYRRMNAEREKEARELRSQGRELAEGIQAAADREVTVIEANAYREAERIRGEGDALATAMYSEAFGKDPEFYRFTRSLRAYVDSFQGKGDLLLLDPDSDFFRYMNSVSGKRKD
jgi:membrane protease subunit HflC